MLNENFYEVNARNVSVVSMKQMIPIKLSKLEAS